MAIIRDQVELRIHGALPGGVTGTCLRGARGGGVSGGQLAGLLDKLLDEGAVGTGESLADEGGHEEVAAEVDVLAEVEPVGGRADPNLDRCRGFAGQRAGEAPTLADVGAHGRVDVRLHAVRQVVERGRIRDLPRR